MGFDLNDGGTRQHTLERARDDDQAAASAILFFAGAMATATVFCRAAGVPNRPAPRQRRGSAPQFHRPGPGRVSNRRHDRDILATMTMPNNMDLYFFAADSGDGASPLYVHRSRPQVDASAPLSRAAIAQGLHWSGELKVADRGWTFIAAPLPGGPGTAVHSGSRMILVAGALISAMLAAYFWTVGRNTRRLQPQPATQRGQ